MFFPKRVKIFLKAMIFPQMVELVFIFRSEILVTLEKSINLLGK